MKKFFAVLAALFFATVAYAQNAGTVTNNAFAIGQGPGKTGYKSVLCAAGQLAVGQAATPICRTLSGDATLSAAGAVTLATVNGNVGSFGSATQCSVFTVNAKGLITAASQGTCTPAVGSITGLGTGVVTALGLNVGSAGAFVTFNGAGGTPSSLVLTNATGLPIGGLTGLGTGVGAALAVNVGSAGAFVTFNGALGTPSSGVGTNLTALNASNVSTGTLNNARLAWNTFTLSANPANPTGTTSATQVMAGVGGTCAFTPSASTRARIQVTGYASNTNANNGTLIQVRFGTGAAPANGAAATGTTIGNLLAGTSATAGANVPFTAGGIVTGLTVGVALWIDLGFAAGANTSTLLGLTCVAHEI